MMAMRLTGRERILVSKTVHPDIAKCWAHMPERGHPVGEIGYEGSPEFDLED